MEIEKKLLNRIAQLEAKNQALQTQIGNVVVTANKRVNSLERDLKAQIAKLQSDYNQMEFKLANLAAKIDKAVR